jgi:hypothetical protein
VARERKTIKVIIPDASPLLTLARVGRLDVFRHFVVTIQIGRRQRGGVARGERCHWERQKVV